MTRCSHRDAGLSNPALDSFLRLSSNARHNPRLTQREETMADDKDPPVQTPAPQPESLCALYTADVQHIAQMKERQWSVLKWVVAILVSYLGLLLSEKLLPGCRSAVVSVFLILISVLTCAFVYSSQRSLINKRKRLWRVYNLLNLSEIVGGTERAYPVVPGFAGIGPIGVHNPSAWLGSTHLSSNFNAGFRMRRVARSFWSSDAGLRGLRAPNAVGHGPAC